MGAVFIFGIIGALLYNLVAKWTGEIEVKIKQLPQHLLKTRLAIPVAAEEGKRFAYEIEAAREILRRLDVLSPTTFADEDEEALCAFGFA